MTEPTLFIAGEAGPERATFTPQGQEMPESGNTYNLYIYEAGSRGNITQDFALLKSLTSGV